MQLTLEQYLQMLQQGGNVPMQKQASGQQADVVNDLSTQVMTKVASALENKQNLVLTPEEVAYLIGLGQSAMQKVAAETAPADSETEEPVVVDADGDGIPDTLVADPEDIVSAIEELLQEGGIDPQQALQILELVEQHLAQEEAMEKQAAENNAAPAPQGGETKKSLKERISGIKNTLKNWGKTVQEKTKAGWGKVKANKKVAIPLALLGLGGVAAGAGYFGYQHYQNQQQ